MKRVTKFAVVSRKAHEFKDCLRRVRRLEEQLEFSRQVLGTSASTVLSNVHELLCKRKSDVNCK